MSPIESEMRQCHSLVWALRLCLLLSVSCAKKIWGEMHWGRLYRTSREVMENHSAPWSSQLRWLWLHNSFWKKKSDWAWCVTQILPVSTGPGVGYGVLFGPLQRAKTEGRPSWIGRQTDSSHFMCVHLVSKGLDLDIGEQVQSRLPPSSPPGRTSTPVSPLGVIFLGGKKQEGFLNDFAWP